MDVTFKKRMCARSNLYREINWENIADEHSFVFKNIALVWHYAPDKQP